MAHLYDDSLCSPFGPGYVYTPRLGAPGCGVPSNQIHLPKPNWSVVCTLVNPATGKEISFSTKDENGSVLLSTSQIPVLRDTARDLYKRLIEAGWQKV